jgi:hypothetical protein
MKKLLNFQDYTIQDRCKILMTICHWMNLHIT